jgi:hypothetical protein
MGSQKSQTAFVVDHFGESFAKENVQQLIGCIFRCSLRVMGGASLGFRRLGCLCISCQIFVSSFNSSADALDAVQLKLRTHQCARRHIGMSVSRSL